MESDDDETVFDTANEVALISKQFKNLIDEIPKSDIVSEEHSRTVVIIKRLEEQFEKLLTLKAVDKRSMKSSGSDTPAVNDYLRYSDPVDRRDAFMANALDKISSALELLHRKPGEVPGLQNSVSGYGGTAGRAAMQVLVKSMDLKKWKGEESEPWDNV